MATSAPHLLPVAVIEPFDHPLKNPPEVPVFSNFAEAAESTNPEVVLIGVPNTTKNLTEMELEILRAGLPVLCTKWRLEDWSFPEQLEEFSTVDNPRYLVRDHYHLTPVFQTARDLLPRVGKIRSVRYRFALPPRPEGFSPWVHSYQHLLLEDLCFHHFAVIQFLCGLQMKSLWCRSRALAEDGSVRNAFDLMAETTGGWLLNYTGHWCVNAPPYTSWPGDIVIEGDDGALELSDQSLIVNGESIAPGDFLPAADWVQAACDCLANATARPKTCLLTLQDYLPVAKAISQCLAASKSEQS